MKHTNPQLNALAELIEKGEKEKANKKTPDLKTPIIIKVKKVGSVSRVQNKIKSNVISPTSSDV